MGAVSSVVETVGDVVGGAVETVSDVASDFDDLVNDTVPGGWATVATVAIPGAGTAIGTTLGLEGAAATLAGNTLIQTAANGGDLEQGLINAGVGAIGGAIAAPITSFTDSPVLGNLAGGTASGLLAGQPLEQALTGGLINTGINQVSGVLANQTPADFANDVNTVLDTPATVPVSAYQQDINQVLDMPATPAPQEQIMVTETPADLTPAPTLQEIVNVLQEQNPSIFTDTTAPELPSGMDLSSDVIPGTANTVEDVSQALAGEGTAISGQDLAADATPGNTLADVSAVLTPTVTPAPAEEPGLNKDQIAQILKTGLGLFGGITAASKALQGLQRTPTSTVAPTAPITPFTGTYSGMNPYDAAYYQQVQQNYNRLFPTTPANVATPLESWYSTQYKPETSVINSLFSPLLK